jgi:hypothetical protein
MNSPGPQPTAEDIRQATSELGGSANYARAFGAVSAYLDLVATNHTNCTQPQQCLTCTCLRRGRAYTAAIIALEGTNP